MLNLTLKNIFYKKTRSILTIMGIVIAMQLYIVLSGIMNAYDEDMQKQIASMAGKVFVQAKTESSTSMLPMQTFITESDANELLKIDGINLKESTMILYNEVSPPQAPNMPPMVFAAGISQGTEGVYCGDNKMNGKIVNKNDVILGLTASNWAKEEYNAGLNDTFTLMGEKFKIVEILPQINASIDSSIIMPIDTAQNLYNKTGLINSLIITAINAKDVDVIAKSITDKNSKVIASTMKDVQKTADKMLAGQRTFFAMINNTIVFVAIFMVMIIMIMAINERKKEIGTLKAIGASYKKILFMVISESTILSVIGGLIALPISILFTFVIFGISSTEYETVLIYNNPKDWPLILLVTIIIGIISGIFPALSARKVNPLESIRYE